MSAEVDVDTGELLPAVPVRDMLVRPAAAAAELLANQRAYHQLCLDLLDESDYQTFRTDKGEQARFKKKSAWRKLNVAFNVDTQLVSEEVTRDDAGHIVRAHVVARAIAPNGRYADGIGVCDRGERGFSKPEHDILATAHTKATNRASSDLYGMGEVSAEEMSEPALPPKRGGKADGPPASPVDKALLSEWFAQLSPPLQHRVTVAAQRAKLPDGGPRTTAERDRLAWIILSNIPERRRPEASPTAWIGAGRDERLEALAAAGGDYADVLPADVHDDLDTPEALDHEQTRYDPADDQPADDPGRPFGND
jgi:hypothetical protein